MKTTRNLLTGLSIGILIMFGLIFSTNAEEGYGGITSSETVLQDRVTNDCNVLPISVNAEEVISSSTDPTGPGPVLVGNINLSKSKCLECHSKNRTYIVLKVPWQSELAVI